LPPRLLGPDAATIVEPLLREKYGFVKRALDVFNGVMRAVSRRRWFRFVAAQSPRVRRRADEPLPRRYPKEPAAVEFHERYEAVTSQFGSSAGI
jgi:hypothetical protein